MINNGDEAKAIEEEIANALKPLEASRRPFVSMVGIPQAPAEDPPPAPSQAQDEPILTLTERLQQLREENGRLQGRIDLLREDMLAMEGRLITMIQQVLGLLG